MQRLATLYGHFAAASGTIMLASGGAAWLGVHLRWTGWPAWIPWALALVYAIRRTVRPSVPRRRRGRYGPFAAALATCLIVMVHVASRFEGDLHVTLPSLIGVLILSLCYAVLRADVRPATLATADSLEALFGYRRLRAVEWVLLSIAGILLTAWMSLEHAEHGATERSRALIAELEEEAVRSLDGDLEREVAEHFQAEMDAAGRWEAFVARYPSFVDERQGALRQRRVDEGGLPLRAVPDLDFRVSSPDPQADFSGHPVLDQHRDRVSLTVRIGPAGLLQPGRLEARILLRPADLNHLLVPRLQQWLESRNLNADLVPVPRGA